MQECSRISYVTSQSRIDHVLKATIAIGHWRTLQYRDDDLLPSLHSPVSSTTLHPERCHSCASASEIPGNVVLQKIGARAWLTICVVGWGAAQIGMAFVPNWGLLCLCRALLGVFEVCILPDHQFLSAYIRRLDRPASSPHSRSSSRHGTSVERCRSVSLRSTSSVFSSVASALFSPTDS